MIAPPNAMSHGLGAATTAGAFAAFTGTSAANAGEADTASAATTDNMTFFIGPRPFCSIGHQPMLVAHWDAGVSTGFNRTPQLASADKIPLCPAIGQAKE